MTVRVLLFASYADAVGVPSLELDVSPGAQVSDVLAAVRGMSRGGNLPPRPLVAVNAEYATLENPVSDGDEVAIIPPVAGG